LASGVVVPELVARLTNPNTRSPVAAAEGPVPAVHAAVEPVALDAVDADSAVPGAARNDDPRAVLCAVDAAYVAVPEVPDASPDGAYA
jgi:hypothetical protein